MTEEHQAAEIPEGKIIDFIDGKARPDTELEQIRQNFERTLIEEYRFDKSDVGSRFPIKSQTDRNRAAQVAIGRFSCGAKAQDSRHIHILIQIAKPGVQPTEQKAEQASWRKPSSPAPRPVRLLDERRRDHLLPEEESKFDTDVLPVNDFPRKGEDASSIFTTDRSRLRVATGNNLLNAFKRCHDFIHANQGGSKEQIFWEFLKILFAKIEDEQHEGRPRFAIRNSDERNTKPGQKEVKDRVEQLFREVRAQRVSPAVHRRHARHPV